MTGGRVSAGPWGWWRREGETDGLELVKQRGCVCRAFRVAGVQAVGEDDADGPVVACDRYQLGSMAGGREWSSESYREGR